jgi:hypothetical protein
MSKQLILIDTSYTSFYRFFATLRWMSLSDPDEYKKYKDDKTYDWSQNTVFIDKYKKMYLESIIKFFVWIRQEIHYGEMILYHHINLIV